MKLQGKMRRYLENIQQNVAAGTEKKLFNNLPVGYHESLKMAIAWSRSEPGSGNTEPG